MRMLELCIANNIGIKAVEEQVLRIPGDKDLPPKRKFWHWKKIHKLFFVPSAQEKWVAKTVPARLEGLLRLGVAAAELARWLEAQHLCCDFTGTSQPPRTNTNALLRWPFREDNCMHCPESREWATSGNETAPQDTATYSLLSAAEGQMSLVQALEIMR